jgi:hypothetical protein
MTASLRYLRKLTLAAVLAGCSPGWHRVTPGSSDALNTRQQFQVWSHGLAHQWHGLRVIGDSVSGVPFTRSPTCDSCRVQLALAEVDSVRAGDPVAGLGGGVGIGLSLGFLVLAVSVALQFLYPAT